MERIKAAIRECLEGTNFKPPVLTFIVVSKRISARFFQPVQNRVQNPPSGTVVDDVVTLPERYDFFLISQVKIFHNVDLSCSNNKYDVNANKIHTKLLINF